MLIKSTFKIIRFLSNNKIPPPPNPTMAESFATKFSTDQLQIIMDPRGYLDQSQKKEVQTKIQVKSQQAVASTSNKSPSNQVEYGYKYKGPEPTRFGDWCLKGKCVDF